MVVGSLISPLSLSLWWPHGCGFCSGSVLIWIGDRGYGFFMGVLEFCRFWFGLLVWVCCGVVGGRLSESHRGDVMKILWV